MSVDPEALAAARKVIRQHEQEIYRKTVRDMTERHGGKAGLDKRLYHADPNCNHELDPNNWSGIKCLHCPGWYCL